ncbi:MAG: hypothetical protein DME19_14820 [Verrucomicrobia bacterium]|nr:MAG: hypothetical protein DME19_14820 [Verrucomicrobiota bacterium]
MYYTFPPGGTLGSTAGKDARRHGGRVRCTMFRQNFLQKPCGNFYENQIRSGNQRSPEIPFRALNLFWPIAFHLM